MQKRPFFKVKELKIYFYKILKNIKKEKKWKKEGFWRVWLKKAKKGPKRGVLGVSREAQKRAKKGSF